MKIVKKKNRKSYHKKQVCLYVILKLTIDYKYFVYIIELPKIMKNTLPQLIYAADIMNEKSDAKKFYRFVGVFQKQVSQKQIIVNENINLKLINQPIQEDITLFKPMENIIVFCQIVEQKKRLEGQIRKITLDQALKYQNLMKKHKFKDYEKSKLLRSHLKGNQGEYQGKSFSGIIGHTNGGLNQHF